MAPKSFLVAATIVLVACSSGDDGDATPTTRSTTACPVPAAVVAAAVGHAVSVERGNEPGSCAYVADAEVAAGARVEVVVRPVDDEAFAAALAQVEQRSGPAVALGDDDVDGADRGWVATVGRSVQLGAADDAELVVVVVTDPLLDAEAAEQAAARIAEEALAG